MSVREWVVVAGLLLAVGGEAGARKARATSSSLESQRALSQGIAAMIRRDFATAAEALTSAFRKAPQPELLYYLGALAQAEGRSLDAHDLMRRYLADPHREGAGSPEQLEAERILRLSRPPHGKLQVVGSDGTLLFVDGRLVGSLPLSQPLLLTPGAHQLRLEAEAERHEESLQVQVGRLLELRYSDRTRSVVLSTVPVLLLLEDYRAPAGSEKALRQALDQAIESEHYLALRPAAALESSSDSHLADCLDTIACQAQLAKENGADYVLRLRSSAEPPPGQRFRLELLHAAIGETAAQGELPCPGSCSATDVGGVFARPLSELLAAAKRRPSGRLLIDSVPTAAEVFRDHQRLGLTPLEVALWAGPVELELRKAGSVSEQRKLSLGADERATLQVALRPLRQTAGLHWVSPPRPRWRYYAGAATAVAGLTLLGVGISALAANGSCVGTPPAANGQCLLVHSTFAVGWPLFGVGLGLATAGGLLIGLPQPKRLEPEPIHAP